MALSAATQGLWHALELGPLWRERTAPAPHAAPASVGAAPEQDWDGLAQAVAHCTKCGLCRNRTQTVFGAGPLTAHWLFVGEAPGAEEDARGEPFVGQAGRLLDNMLAAIELGRERTGDAGVYIANVVKCRPPGNRNPEPAEVASCRPYLERQIALLQPRVIVLMGRFAAQTLLATDASIASLRGRIHEIRRDGRTYPAIVTYHPAYLLRNLADKSRAWDDLCRALATYERLRAGQPA